MEQNKHPEFEEIRCFYDEDVPSKLWPLADEPAIEPFVKAVKPDLDMDKFRMQVKSLHTIKDFQEKIVAQFVLGLAKQTTDSLELKGTENIKAGRAATYITNHRDIVLDSAFLNSMLAVQGMDTAEIAIGDNLLAYDWIKDLVRLNKSFIVLRSVPVRQMLEVSKRLSAYIHYTIKEKKNPVWIAQREGRSKDSSDQTQSSVIKMLAMGGESRDLIQNIRQLNFQPVALSYEFDPCDYLKAQEFQLKRDNPEWKKTKQDDLLSMATGLRGYKGRVVFTICPEINDTFDTYPWINDKNAQVNTVCQTVDKALHSHMELFPINYVAYNLKYETDKYADKYTAEEEKKALAYLNGQLAKIQIPNRDEAFLWERLLTMYSNPVVNKENA
ncbi:MAG: 1-acyl-sn-glycerol-3-phosphate acyltransferase [Bacteroidales bacterium]|nr:1-acyl-sn-glycerol-3-phosphate acyltransferase [Candidatus Liminaster caballi]